MPRRGDQGWPDCDATNNLRGFTLCNNFHPTSRSQEYESINSEQMCMEKCSDTCDCNFFSYNTCTRKCFLLATCFLQKNGGEQISGMRDRTGLREHSIMAPSARFGGIMCGGASRILFVRPQCSELLVDWRLQSEWLMPPFPGIQNAAGAWSYWACEDKCLSNSECAAFLLDETGRGHSSACQ